MRNSLLVLGAAAIAATTFMFESDASACGGCFHTPGETPTIVTDHRMILSVSQGQTTLYDQIKYQGSPGSFAWVLPVSGEIEVGLSADVVFGTLDTLTATLVLQPPMNCPSRPESCDDGNGDSLSASPGRAADAGAASPGVEVTKQEVVGPYQTVQLHSTDPAALQTWLADNGFSLPADVKPIVDQYVTEHFDFLALKLLPEKGVTDMRPVRVTTKGASAVLPLRMVAAGTGATVGITLWVVAEGRYEPTNFPWFHIADDDIAWDWTQSKSNYTELRAQKSSELAGRGWEVESSIGISQPQVVTTVMNGGQAFPGGAQVVGDYAPVLDGQGVVVKTEDQVRDDDLETLFKGIPNGASRVTRLRADVAHAALAADLTLNASSDQNSLSNRRTVTKELNQPLCPVYVNCQQSGTAPRDQAAAASNGGGPETFSCSTRYGRRNSVWLAAGLGVAVMAITRTIRRRRRV